MNSRVEEEEGCSENINPNQPTTISSHLSKKKTPKSLTTKERTSTITTSKKNQNKKMTAPTLVTSNETGTVATSSTCGVKEQPQQKQQQEAPKQEQVKTTTAASPTSEDSDYNYTLEKIVPEMKAVLTKILYVQHRNTFKVSDIKEVLMRVSEKYLKIGIDILLEQGVIALSEGRSRVVTYEIKDLPMPVELLPPPQQQQEDTSVSAPASVKKAKRENEQQSHQPQQTGSAEKEREKEKEKVNVEKKEKVSRKRKSSDKMVKIQFNFPTTTASEAGQARQAQEDGEVTYEDDDDHISFGAEDELLREHDDSLLAEDGEEDEENQVEAEREILVKRVKREKVIKPTEAITTSYANLNAHVYVPLSKLDQTYEPQNFTVEVTEMTKSSYGGDSACQSQEAVLAVPQVSVPIVPKQQEVKHTIVAPAAPAVASINHEDLNRRLSQMLHGEEEMFGLTDFIDRFCANNSAMTSYSREVVRKALDGFAAKNHIMIADDEVYKI